MPAVVLVVGPQVALTELDSQGVVRSVHMIRGCMPALQCDISKKQQEHHRPLKFPVCKDLRPSSYLTTIVSLSSRCCSAALLGCRLIGLLY
jgi:hypothetical protein